MEFSVRGFKCHSGQPSIATSKNPSVVNTKLLSKTIKNRQSGKKKLVFSFFPLITVHICIHLCILCIYVHVYIYTHAN